MKKNWMKVVVVALSCMMAVAMTGCGGGSSSSGFEDGTLKIGTAGPLTGPAALYGVAVKNGAQLAVDEINASDPEFKLSFVAQDDEHDAEKSVNAFNKLMDEGMQVLAGTVTTAPCTAVAAEAYANRVFALTPSASGPTVTADNDNVYQLCFSDPNQGIAVADYIAANYPDAKVGVIYNNADNYSSGIFDKFKSEYESKGKKIVAVEAFADDANADFTAQLNSCKDAGADMLFLPIYYTPASNIMTQADKMGYAPTYFGVDGMDGILDLEGFDTKLAEGVLLLTPFTPYSEDEKVQAFVAAYEEAYGEKPIQFAADAYDVVYALYNACLEAGVGPDNTAEEICDALIKTFNGGFKYEGGLTGDSMQWNSAGEVNKTPKVCEIQGGKYIEK
ncbi:MAG: ABC transporter substrate-binding protein [Clostridiales bacterium]|nr:ABC transporter substrate-binding protein [Candidatus Crickella equi]